MASEVKRLVPQLFKNNAAKLSLGIWPWTTGTKSRLPQHYKKHVIERYMKEPAPVHYLVDERKYRFTKHGERRLVQNIPIPLTFPTEADLGLWGGEGFIKGYKKRNNKKLKPPHPHIWKPRLYKKALYSEVLDRWMEITVTKRTLDLIDEAYGFDFYILKTHEVDLRSKLGMRLKKEMMMTLIKRSMYPENPSKQEEIYSKYKDCLLPEEEVSWLGLSLTQAVHKVTTEDNQLQATTLTPHKVAYMEQLIAQIRSNSLEEPAEEKEESTLSKLNPFK